MGEHKKDTTDETEALAIKAGITSVATFAETCAKSIEQISANRTVGPAGKAHLFACREMLQQCALSMRSFAASFAGARPEYLRCTPADPLDDRDDPAPNNDDFLDPAQEELLGSMLTYSSVMNEDDNGTRENDVGEGQEAMPEPTMVPGRA